VVTKAGLALYRKVMPVARARQAAFIRTLSVAERRVLFGALHKLRDLCGADGEDADL
jgi:hypothetical protein